MPCSFIEISRAVRKSEESPFQSSRAGEPSIHHHVCESDGGKYTLYIVYAEQLHIAIYMYIHNLIVESAKECTYDTAMLISVPMALKDVCVSSSEPYICMSY